jgi:hypothetical protein
MTLAAIDRLVHHATILEMNVESYRRNAALERKRGKGQPPAHATYVERPRGQGISSGDSSGWNGAVICTAFQRGA